MFERSAMSKKMPCPEDCFKNLASVLLHLLPVLQTYLPASMLCARLRDILYLLVLNSKVCHMKFHLEFSGSLYKLSASRTPCKIV